jgi:threonine/homoserine/homoserine lactone efflux protein
MNGSFLVQVTIICVTFSCLTFPCAGAWLVFGASLQRLLRDPKHLRLFNIAMALLLVASILPVIADLFSD